MRTLPIFISALAIFAFEPVAFARLALLPSALSESTRFRRGIAQLATPERLRQFPTHRHEYDADQSARNLQLKLASINLPSFRTHGHGHACCPFLREIHTALVGCHQTRARSCAGKNRATRQQGTRSKQAPHRRPWAAPARRTTKQSKRRKTKPSRILPLAERKAGTRSLYKPALQTPISSLPHHI